MPNAATRRAQAPAPAPPPTIAASPIEAPRLKYRATAAAALAFGLMVAVLWGAYGPGCGMPYETSFAYNSETTSALRGFLYSDALRIHTNTFYHLSYLIGEAFGIRGSYFPYQVVYALLWWARGLLVFVILRKFLPHCLPLCYAAGALVLIHASDGATFLLGQMNQLGYMFWMLLAMYCFLRACDSNRRSEAAGFATAAAIFEYLSLWSYESQLLLILVFPALTMLAKRERRKPATVVAWYAVPAAYLVSTYLRYAHSGGGSYQESVLRKSWSLASIVDDWTFNIGASLRFWDWESLGWRTPRSEAHVLAALVAVAFIAGWLMIGLSGVRRGALAVNAKSCWNLLAAGVLILAMSFPVYLVLNSARGLWRTQLLSGIGSALVLAAGIGFLSCIPMRRSGRLAVALLSGGAITYCGSVAAIEKSGVHRYNWDTYRTAMTEVLQAAPMVRPGTVIVVTNVPKNADPFDHNMWFDLAVRLAYPGVPVAGAYYYTDGSSGPGNDLVLEGAKWRWNGGGFARLLTETPLERTIVVEYDPKGHGRLLQSLPAFLCSGGCFFEKYSPSHVIAAGPISPIALRRYNVAAEDASAEKHRNMVQKR